MIPRLLLDTAPIPGGDGELRLYRRGDDFSITLGGSELMSSRLNGSEQALATMACERILPRPKPHMLIGGLGMGFTLRAALGVLPRDATVTVAELVPAVVDWARGPMTPIFGDSLDDPRLAIEVTDVAGLIRGGEGCYDAILLDVDNGPDGLTHDRNERLYRGAGLRAAYAALRPGGVLAVWSSAPDKAFVLRLATAGFAVDEMVVRSNNGRGARHILWFGKRA
ncbi:MAG: spermidine synthase [Sphingomonas bacterium]|nr:spermidine synthase [Sphingomonas bacterium]